jgi:hypothetical protein
MVFNATYKTEQKIKQYEIFENTVTLAAEPNVEYGKK